MDISYKVNQSITTDEFIGVLTASNLAECRPVDDRECLDGMLKNSNLIVTAWDEEKLIGIARSMTDFHYACYLSDIAVDKNYQNNSIGRQLQIVTQEQLGPRCKLILIAAPASGSYYEHIGFTNNQRCWVLCRDSSINS